ncbi:MAG: hypothetical protein NZ741_01410 [Armatimonadetes bacterium]|nr:hypothetical protein [Armatimonadota bacterium]
MHLLQPAQGVLDVRDPRVAEAAQQLLALPPEEQVTAAQWMGTQPDYAGVLTYLVAQAGVTGALRRAVKQALFELRRRGVQVALPQEQAPAPAATTSAQQWTVEEAFMAAPYMLRRRASAAHVRFFLRHTSGQRAVFTLDIDPLGYLYSAQLTDERVEERRQECLQNPFSPPQQGEREGLRNRFVRAPVEWAVQVVHEARQRNIREHEAVPPHAAFYWSRLPEPQGEAVPSPADSLPDAETGWLVTSILVTPSPNEPPGRIASVFLPYAAHPQDFAQLLNEVMREMDTRIVLTPQTEEERRRQVVERMRERLFPDDRLREGLLFLLPVWSSVYLLGGDREVAVWLKAMWRELKERPDRPFHQTQVAQLLTSLSLVLFMSAAGIEAPEGKGDEPPSTQA